MRGAGYPAADPPPQHGEQVRQPTHRAPEGWPPARGRRCPRLPPGGGPPPTPGPEASAPPGLPPMQRPTPRHAASVAAAAGGAVAAAAGAAAAVEAQVPPWLCCHLTLPMPQRRPGRQATPLPKPAPPTPPRLPPSAPPLHPEHPKHPSQGPSLPLSSLPPPPPLLCPTHCSATTTAAI